MPTNRSMQPSHLANVKKAQRTWTLLEAPTQFGVVGLWLCSILEAGFNCHATHKRDKHQTQMTVGPLRKFLWFHFIWLFTVMDYEKIYIFISYHILLPQFLFCRSITVGVVLTLFSMLMIGFALEQQWSKHLRHNLNKYKQLRHLGNNASNGPILDKQLENAWMAGCILQHITCKQTPHLTGIQQQCQDRNYYPNPCFQQKSIQIIWYSYHSSE